MKQIEPIIVFKKASKVFPTAEGGENEVLKDLDLTIGRGRIFGIVGLSGAGKSTLIRLINQLERLTSGTLLIDGQDVTRQHDGDLINLRRHIGMIFQNFNLMRNSNVFENIAFPLRITNYTKDYIENRVNELLDTVGLKEHAQSYPLKLSGGQKQRVAIARALALHPDILLCDEATSALDPRTAKSILDLLKSVNSDLGVTVIIVTHDMSVIKYICDDVAVLDGGEIVEQGLVADIFANPQSLIKTFLHGFGGGQV
ncbi:MAG TPA: ATP-binding cassette domain-containing protein [Bacillota bacterium]|nr:MAG: Methionine import ATP-binding protein MetN [Firmicutes bacterium ADurb.Bin153]HNV35144.1 ATP-binding cassette domain-containing protein [Bacillota bacterium]HPU95403.1 ATP-binding cassette domain-containing protein [Bacillota bacterium]